jgi:predicted 3-demethylubiquinone-9 3-methyltransferase (glyoxalase superfamily)
MKPLTTCLWFDHQAEDAAKFYVSIFKNSKMGPITRYGEESAKAAGRPKGSAMVVTFELNGQKFMGLNGGPMFKFTEAISFVVSCDTQKELDRYWAKLSEGGAEVQCGWLKDKYGLSWQIVPAVLSKLMSGKDPKKSERVMKAMLQMKKLDINGLQQAARSSQ